MFRSMKWVAPLAALGLMLSLSAARVTGEETKKQTGNISGTVTGADGKPASGVLVRLFHPMSAGKKSEKKAQKKQIKAEQNATESEKPAKGEKGDKSKAADKPIPVANATTSGDGTFEMKDVPVGTYMIMANLKGAGQARQTIEVKAADAAKVTLTLKHNTTPPNSSEKKAEKKAQKKED